MSQFLSEVWQTLREAAWFLFDNFLAFQDPAAGQLRQVRVLYGSGAIDRKRLFQLENQIQRGQLIQGEITMIQRVAQLNRAERGELLSAPVHREIQRALEILYEDRALLEEACYSTELTLQALAADIHWLQNQAQLARQEAAASLPDETLAHNHLAIRQEFLDYALALTRRRDALQPVLNDFKALEAQLRISEARLNLLKSQEHMAMVRLRITQEFHR
jgi:hypothetical protein